MRNSVVIARPLSMEGQFLDSEMICREYATDESIFFIRPSAVVRPKNVGDLKALVSWAQDHQISLTPRGAGSNTTGGAIGSGIIVDFKYYFNKILEIGSGWAWVEPGVVLDQLNLELQSTGQIFAPDPGSHAFCTLGGMVANNAAGPKGFVYGSTLDHLEALRVVTSEGVEREFSATSTTKEMESFLNLCLSMKSRIHRAFPRTKKNASGYSLKKFLESKNPAHLWGCSEGTLGLITAIKIRLRATPTFDALRVLPYETFEGALRDLPSLREAGAVSIELLDETILHALRKVDPAFFDETGLSNARASLWVGFEDPKNTKALDRGFLLLGEDKRRASLLRSKASKAISEQSRHRKPLRFVEDAAVPLDRLEEYALSARDILRSHESDGAIFGHAGDGHLHMNPQINIHDPQMKKKIERILQEISGLVLRLGGTLTAEHGDGILRSSWAMKQWAELLPIFEILKSSFDPNHIFNPGKKLAVEKREVWPKFRKWSEAREVSPGRTELVS